MRGKEWGVSVEDAGIGITPAHAGKSPGHSSGEARNWDHPRTCGEKQVQVRVICTIPGSPPHMRGKVFYHKGEPKSTRITPAHAGKSCRAAAASTRGREHPRTCGEKRSPGYRGETPVGSPPHMRGKDSLRLCQPPGSRITPAHAGKRLNLQ